MRSASLIGLATLAVACGGARESAAPPWIAEAPPGPDEPRAELVVRVDLEPSATCEEALDAILYRTRGVDLARWDAGGSRCRERTLRLRWLPRRTSEDAILGVLRKNTRSVEKGPPR